MKNDAQLINCMAFHLCAFVSKFLCVQVFIMEQKSLNLIHSETGQMHLITKTTCDPDNRDCQRLGPPKRMNHWLVHVEKHTQYINIGISSPSMPTSNGNLSKIGFCKQGPRRLQVFNVCHYNVGREKRVNPILLCHK